MLDNWFPRGKEGTYSRIWAVGGAVLAAAGLLGALWLNGGVLDRLTVLVLLALWTALGLFFLRRMDLEPRAFALCLLPLGLAVLLRVVCMDHITYDYQDFLSHWAEYFRQSHGFLAIKDPVGNYNVPYLYFLATISYLPVYDLYLIKLFSVFFDLLLAFAGLRLARKAFRSDIAGAAAFSLLLVLPTAVLNGALWGQCDSLYTALTLLALADALENHPGRSLIWLGVAFSFKLQTIFLIPLWCVLWYAGRVKFRHFFLFPAAYVGTILPALLLGKPLVDILSVYADQTTTYNDRLTLNAPSLYALIPYGVEVDTALFARIGIIAAFLFLAAVLLWLFFFRQKLTDDHLLAAGLIMAIGIPLLLPHMHDRYFFLADTLGVVWAMGGWKRAPVPTAVLIASLGAYHAYLVLRYAFPMAWGAYLLLGALIGLIIWLAWSLSPKAQSAPRRQKKR